MEHNMTEFKRIPPSFDRAVATDIGQRMVRELGIAVDDDYAPPIRREMIEKLETRLNDKLYDIASSVISLNYGDMITFAAGVGAEPQAVFDWAKGYIDPPPDAAP
jgi:hypothetical protein